MIRFFLYEKFGQWLFFCVSFFSIVSQTSEMLFQSKLLESKINGIYWDNSQINSACDRAVRLHSNIASIFIVLE
jgi:hypothetical protein